VNNAREYLDRLAIPITMYLQSIQVVGGSTSLYTCISIAPILFVLAAMSLKDKMSLSKSSLDSSRELISHQQAVVKQNYRKLKNHFRPKQVTQVVNKVLDNSGARGYLLDAATDVPTTSVIPAGAQKSYRDYVVAELVDTERKYVQDLENLHELKKKIEQKGVIPGDVVHDIFLNINAILDFQRRFLIKIETTNSQPDDQQAWGLPFTNYEESFNIYRPFIANQRKAADIAKRDFDKLMLADHPVVVDFNTLDGFLLKPMQRLVKYPMLLKVSLDTFNSN
jgi:hypothetical protein